MSIDIFLLLLMATSVLCSLVTEGLKVLFSEWEVKYYANTLAGVVAIILGLAFGAGYMIMAESAFNAKMMVLLIALVLLSWLSAMVGYDKVKQAITQIAAGK